ncbi:hypothetical protein RMCBS344292_12603 [Rhizopus microsporus]|nr:hypothetical protein RMCBS344292_12603 [Rhizopus microsporus]
MNNKESDLSLKVTEQLMNSRYSTSSATPLISHMPSSSAMSPSSDRQQQQQQQQQDRPHDRPFPGDASILKPKMVPDQDLVWSNIKELKRSPKEEPSETEKPAWWILKKDDEDGFYSVGGLLFLFGFLFPPFWWLGSFWPRQVREKGGKMAERWQRLNRIMSIGFSTIVIILIIVFAALYSTHQW